MSNEDFESRIKVLVMALERIAEDFAPWHGEDALNMRDIAREALKLVRTPACGGVDSDLDAIAKFQGVQPIDDIGKLKIEGYDE